jgi:hypothetical protein
VLAPNGAEPTVLDVLSAISGGDTIDTNLFSALATINQTTLGVNK